MEIRVEEADTWRDEDFLKYFVGNPEGKLHLDSLKLR
jgi:hypothetical protein